MNVILSIFLLYAYSANDASAFYIHRSRKPTTTKSSLPTSHRVGGPLLLTPLINTGKLEGVRNRSRVTPLLDDIESYAGFLTVNETTKSHLYFWFIPKTAADYASSPVILWLQGGPGCSSLFGLFTENGPFEVTKEGGVKRRVHAWTNNYHMLYIDQPVGTGFSFTEEDGYISTEEEVAEHLHAALLQFFELFSEFKERDFYIAGESYAGKYVPALGHKIHAVRQQPDVYHIPLKGMMIGNGYSDPENMLDYAAFLHGTGNIDGNERRILETLQDEVRYHIRGGNWLQAASWLDKLIEGVHNFTGLSSLYDYSSDGDIDDELYTQFITDDRVRRLIHVGGLEYEACSLQINFQFRADSVQTVRPAVEELLEHYQILFYNGQFDIICAHWLTENYLDKLHWSGAAKFASAKKQVWQVGDRLAGYYKSSGNLVYAMVRNAGHMVPTDQPESALSLIDMFVEKKLYNNSM